MAKNVVVVPKKQNKFRMCIDDLNKACPNNFFLVLNIDQMINDMVGHEIMNFLDVYSRYN